MPPWLPTLLAIVVTALALTATGSPPAAASRRRLWMASIFVFGSLTIAATVRVAYRQTEEHVALAGSGAGPAAPSAQSYGPSVADLNRRIRALEDHVKELEAGSQARSITQASADGLAAYLKQFG